jgi:uncharacterized protein YdeI (YjbR/CyaY-like superfamily)
MQMTSTFHAPERETWHQWLEQHHATEKEIWLVYFKSHTGISSVPYPDSVEEALCFGWVDSLIQKIDENQYARKFTPRRVGSVWSETNKNRVAKLIAEGRMTPAGFARIDFPLDVSAAISIQKEGTIPEWLSTGLRSNSLAWENFLKLPPSHQKRYVTWLTSARKDETRTKRMQDAMALLVAGKRLGIGKDEERR